MKLSKKARFVHDLLTLSTNVQGYSTLLLDGSVGKLTAKQRECLKIISNEALRLHRLTRRFEC